MPSEREPYSHVQPWYFAEAFRVRAHRSNKPVEYVVDLVLVSVVLTSNLGTLLPKVRVLAEFPLYTCHSYFAANSCALLISWSLNSRS